MWTLWLLGFHPDLQEKAYEEVKSVTGEVLDYDDVCNLTFLDCIIKVSGLFYKNKHVV